MIIAGGIAFQDEEAYLVATLDSVAAQTRPLDRLLPVDDGSPDGSAEIAQRRDMR